MTLTELKTLLDGATDGKWMQISETLICGQPDSNMVSVRICDVARTRQYKSNAALIATSRTALPKALALLEVMAGALEGAKLRLEGAGMLGGMTDPVQHSLAEYEKFKQKVD